MSIITYPNMMPDIVVAGTGIRSPDQFTLESLEWLHRCQLVLTILPPGPVTAFLSAQGLRVESLAHFYQPGNLRPQIYATVIETVLNAAMHYRPLGYVTSGNPVVVDNMALGVFRAASAKGLQVLMLPAISSIDTILIDLKHDIVDSGLQIYEASWFVGHAIEPRTDVPCLLLQVNAFGTAFAAIGHEPTPAALKSLREHLIRFYPPSHLILLVASSDTNFSASQVIQLRIADLDEVRSEHIASGTMFIPPAHSPQVVNEEFIKRMYDHEHHKLSWQYQ